MIAEKSMITSFFTHIINMYMSHSSINGNATKINPMISSIKRHLKKRKRS